MESLYACAQKNAGPAGVTVVIIRKDLLPRSSETLPGYLNFQIHAEAQSLWNTAPTFPIYILMLVTKWLINDIGGLAKMEAQNRAKSKLLYDVLDASNGFYKGHSQPAWRSMMNVSFRLPSEELTKKFVDGAEKQGMTDLKGHRSVGGIRASIYNAMPVEGVEKLRELHGRVSQAECEVRWLGMGARDWRIQMVTSDQFDSKFGTSLVVFPSPKS